MSRWDDFGVWAGGRLRREAFFFPSGGERLYGSVYAPATAGEPVAGIVLCNSWGLEGNHASRLVHTLCHRISQAGGVGFCFHYPGFGDSSGDLEQATLDQLVQAAVDAAGEAAGRYPNVPWALVGPMLGASIAALAVDRGAVAERLVLIQPALCPEPYFSRLERAARRSLGDPPSAEGYAYGYPLGPALLESVAGSDGAVAAALGRFRGDGAIIAFETPAELPGAPQRFAQLRVPGSWRFGKEDHSALITAASKWPLANAAVSP